MNNKVEERFKSLLEKDEEIQKIERPAKFRFFIIQTLIILMFAITISVCSMIEIVDYYGFEVIWAVLGVSAFCILIYMLFATLYYRNIYYCITNKRLIIRSGVVGADYKAVEFKDVSKIEVKRIWFDKWFKRSSGTIILGSLEDKDIEQHFDEVCALFRLSGIKNVVETEKLLNENLQNNKPKEEAKESDWKSVNKAQQNKKNNSETNKSVQSKKTTSGNEEKVNVTLETEKEVKEKSQSKPKKTNTKNKK